MVRLFMGGICGGEMSWASLLISVAAQLIW